MKFSKESFEYMKRELETALYEMNKGTPEKFNFLSVEFSASVVLGEIEKARKEEE